MTKKRQERTAAPASPLAPGLPALLRSLFDAVARTASRMTYQIAYVIALAFLSDKRGKNRRADVFARKCEENAQKNAPTGISIILNTLFLWFLGTALPRRQSETKEPALEISLNTEGFFSEEPVGSPPSGGTGSGDGLAKASTIKDTSPTLSNPVTGAVNPIPTITSDVTATVAALQVTALTNAKTIGSEISISGSDITQAQSEETSPSGTGGTGTSEGNTGGTGEGTGEGQGEGQAPPTTTSSIPGGQLVGGALVHGDNIGILIDHSSSMGNRYWEAREAIQRRRLKKNTKITVEAIPSCAFAEPYHLEILRKIEMVAKTRIKTLYIYADFQDPQESAIILQVEQIIKQYNLKFNLTTFGRHPSPELYELTQKTGGIYSSAKTGKIFSREEYQTAWKEQEEKREREEAPRRKKWKEMEEKLQKSLEEGEAKQKAQREAWESKRKTENQP